RIRVVGEYIYEDEQGRDYLKVKRIERADGGKAYPQFHREGEQWVKGKPGGPKIPYRLPQLLEAPQGALVFMAEGEKCADILRSLGVVATTASEGAEKWTSDLNRWFQGFRCIVVPDHDAPGRRHGELVARNLEPVAAEVRMLDLPGLSEGEDVEQWVARGGTVEELLRLAEAKPKAGVMVLPEMHWDGEID